VKVLTENEKPENVLSGRIIQAAIEVHRELGPGLLESVYQTCLCKELGSTGIAVHREMVVPICYKGENTGQVLRIDIMVEDLVIVEVKSSLELMPVFSLQLNTYLKLTQKKLGLLINFNVPLVKDGIRRIAHGL
jgi:GxxExxY protein